MPFYGPSGGGGYPPIYNVYYIYTNPYYVITTNAADLIYVISGSHEVFSGGGNDVIYSNGYNQIWAGPGDDLITSNARDYIVRGEAGNDTLIGSSSWDNLHGGADDDVIIAGAGGDFIDGGTGDDTLSGGSGADFFAFHVGDGDDVITDYQAGIDDIAISFFNSGERPDVSWAKVGDAWVITYGADESTITLQSALFNPDDLLIS